MGRGEGGQATIEARKDEGQTNLYIESKLKSINSSIKQEDYEVYMRVKTYQNKLNRLSKKLIHSIKWLPYSKRFDMWKESRKMILRHKAKLEKDTYDMLLRVSRDIEAKLEAIGISEEKPKTAVTARYTYHLKTRELVSRFQRIQNSYVCDSQHPFMLFASNVELKFKLVDISRGFPELNCT